MMNDEDALLAPARLQITVVVLSVSLCMTSTQDRTRKIVGLSPRYCDIY